MAEKPKWTPELWADYEIPPIIGILKGTSNGDVERAIACVDGCIGIGKPEKIRELIEKFKAYKRLEDERRQSQNPDAYLYEVAEALAWAKLDEALAALELD